MMYEVVICLSVPFRSKHFDTFLAFSVDLGNYVHIQENLYITDTHGTEDICPL